jgi:hypothetical protein
MGQGQQFCRIGFSFCCGKWNKNRQTWTGFCTHTSDISSLLVISYYIQCEEVTCVMFRILH